MKTKILIVAIVLVAGIIISPVLGMTISPTRNLILKLAPQEAILTLADKISEQKKMTEQQQINPEEIQEVAQEEVQPKETISELQSTIIPAVQLGDNKEQTEACQNTKSDCEKRIKSIKNEIDDLESQAEEQKKLYDEDKNRTSDEKWLKYRKAMVEKSEKDLKSRKAELQNITNGECKNYNKPC